MTNGKRLQGQVCLLCLVLLAVSAHLEARRSKRSLSQLATMISCATKNNWMDYSNYGCYCGPGGKGKPVDKVDRCCQKHDRCYDQVMSSMKCMISLEVYFISYQVTKCFHCRPSYSPCSSAICRCDSKLAKCLQNKKLQKRYELHDQTKCSHSYIGI